MDEVKMVAKNVRVLFADDVPDDVGEIIELDGIEFDSDVPVRIDYDVTQKVGVATLRKDEHGILADFEVLLPLGCAEQFIPGIGGITLEKAQWDPPQPDGARYLLKRVRVTEIGLHIGRNADKRIEPVRFAEAE